MLKGWLNRSMLVIMVVAMSFACAQSMVRPLIAPYATALGAGPLLAGLAVSLQPLPGFILAVPLGAVADRFGRRRVLMAGAAFLSLGGVVLAAVPTLAGLFVGQLIAGLGVLALGVGGQAAATMPAGGSTVDVRRVSAFSTLLMVGHMIGPAVGGFLSDLGGYRTAFVALVALAAGTGLVSLLLPDGRRDTARAGDEQRVPFSLFASYPQAREMARQRGVLAAVVASSLGVALLQIRTAFVPLHLDQAGWSPSAIGLALSGAGLAGLVSRAVLPSLERRFSMRSMMTVALVVGAGSLSVAVLATGTQPVYVALALSGFALSPTNPLTMLLLSRLISPDQRGLGVGLRLTLNRFSNWIAPVIIGGAAAVIGIHGSLVTASVVAAGTGAIVSRTMPRRDDPAVS